MVLLDGSQPLRYGLKLELDDKYRQLKRALCDLCGLEPADILLVEVYSGVVRVSVYQGHDLCVPGVMNSSVCV